jgi:hypothetical protein
LDQLLAIINLNWKRHDEGRFEVSDEWTASAIYQETLAIDRHISTYLEHYYPNGIPDVSQFADKVVPEWSGLSYYPSNSITKLLLASTVHYLNEKQIQFVEGQRVITRVFSATPIPLDSDDQTQPKWLAQIDYADYRIRAFLPLSFGFDGTYTVLANDIPVYAIPDTDTSIEIDAEHDFNADGNNDVVIARQFYFAGGISGSLSVYAWDGKGLSHAGEVNLPSVNPRYGETYASDYTIVDPPSGPAEIRVIWPRFRAFDCAWNTEYTYRWVVDQLVRSALNEEIPNKPECYIAKALESERPQEQAHWFQLALAQLKPEGDTEDRHAWLLIRLAVALSAQGREADAENALKSLAALPGIGNFSKAAKNAYAHAGPTTLAICNDLPQNLVPGKVKVSRVYFTL